MSILKRYAKDTPKEPTEVLSLRIPRSIYNKYKEHCDQYGLSLAEATAILIKTELGDSYKAPSREDVTKTIQKKNYLGSHLQYRLYHQRSNHVATLVDF